MKLSIMKRLSIGQYCQSMLIFSICLLYFFCLAIVLKPIIAESNTINLFPFEKHDINNNAKNYIENDTDTDTDQRISSLSSSNLFNNNDQKLLEHFHQRKLQNHLVIKDKLFSKIQVPFNQRNLTLDDLFISVKTTRIFHKSRLDIILDTWHQLAKNQTYFFTDTNEDEYKSKLGDHIINTNCSVSHNRRALCCKMSVEFDYFIDSGKKWWCHFDDDNYVNIPKLVQLLNQYDPLLDWYLGKTSIKQPLEIEDRMSKKKINFSFATGGAGFCVSRALGLKMIPVASNGRLISVGDQIRLPDDVTIGYIIEHILGKKLTIIKEFHSHLEPMAVLETNELQNQISFSYSGNNINRNILSLNQIDPNDSTRN